MEIQRYLEAFGDDETSLKKVANYIKKLLSKKEEKHLEVTPELKRIIEEAEREYEQGHFVEFSSIEDLHNYLESL